MHLTVKQKHTQEGCMRTYFFIDKVTQLCLCSANLIFCDDSIYFSQIAFYFTFCITVFIRIALGFGLKFSLAQSRFLFLRRLLGVFCFLLSPHRQLFKYPFPLYLRIRIFVNSSYHFPPSICSSDFFFSSHFPHVYLRIHTFPHHIISLHLEPIPL